jgi:hypothetical protein
MNLSTASNTAIEAAAQSYRDQQLATYVTEAGYGEPDLTNFIHDVAYYGEYVTPDRSYDQDDLIEWIEQGDHITPISKILLEALKDDPENPADSAARDWQKLVKAMAAAAQDYFYEKHPEQKPVREAA